MLSHRPEIIVEGLQPLIARPAASERRRWPSWRPHVAESLRTTPGRLVLMSIVALIGALCFGVAATVAEVSRARAADAVQTQTEPLLARAVDLSTALSDANATATTTFLIGGLEPPARRARYLADLKLASESLTTLARQVSGPPDARAAVSLIGGQLPLYSGLVETARAGNRQNFPVGAAYMRRASSLLTGTVLPAAAQLFSTEARRLSDGYSTGTSTWAVLVLSAIGSLILVLLVTAQIYLARVSRRTFNLPLVAATVVLVATSVWALIGIVGEQNALSDAQRNGSDLVEVASATRVLVARAQTDQSLILVNRGSDQTDPLDFKAVMQTLAPEPGLIGQLAALDRRNGMAESAVRIHSEFLAYQNQTRAVESLQGNDQLAAADEAASIENRLSGHLAAQTTAAQARFDRAAADASGSLSGLSVAIPILTVLSTLLVLGGLQQRLREYR